MPDGKTSLISNSPPVRPIRRVEINEFSAADVYFWRHLWQRYGNQPFPRGYLDIGRLNRLFGQQILPVDAAYNETSRETQLRCVPYIEPVRTG
jgi:hypothetical protein